VVADKTDLVGPKREEVGTVQEEVDTDLEEVDTGSREAGIDWNLLVSNPLVGEDSLGNRLGIVVGRFLEVDTFRKALHRMIFRLEERSHQNSEKNSDSDSFYDPRILEAVLSVSFHIHQEEGWVVGTQIHCVFCTLEALVEALLEVRMGLRDWRKGPKMASWPLLGKVLDLID
jgi:hypothetical protein